jgi:hypothetical protein
MGPALGIGFLSRRFAAYADGVEGGLLAAVPVGVGAGEPLVGSLAVGWPLLVPPPVLPPVAGGVEAVVVGGCVLGGVVGADVVGGGVVGLDGVLLALPPPEVGVVGSLVTGMPPCRVTTIPPGLNTIRAVHWPLGAADVAVAVMTRLCPAASDPEP